MPEQPGKLKPALFGGIVAGVMSGLPYISFINCFCCAGVMLGGLLGVFFYTRDLTPDMPPLTSSDSIQIGVLSGVFAAVISTILSILVFLTMGNVVGRLFFDMFVSFYESMGLLDQLPPGTIEQMEEELGAADMSPIAFVFSFILYPLFGLLGGLIGYAFFKPRTTMMPPPQVPGPQTPMMS